MNIVVTLLQVLIGLWHITGGVYMSQNYEGLITEWASGTLPPYFWVFLGVVEVLLGLGLVLSSMKKFRKFAVVSALGLAVVDLLGLAFFSTYTGAGMLWPIVPAALLVFIAYWRKSKK